jgi:DNA processing protein
MNKAIYYKALQLKKKYRNTEDYVHLEVNELRQAAKYLEKLKSLGIQYTYPGHFNYPRTFEKMIEAPLFLEYIGSPCWNTYQFISVVGSRDCHELSLDWINTQLIKFLMVENVGVVSGGARGIDMNSHLACLRSKRPTIAVIPSGLGHIYPRQLSSIQADVISHGGALVSEFSYDEQIKKSYFYFRNRIIANLGQVCLVVQAGLKSGTMLTVHHALQNGRPVITVPSHPGLIQFSGNLKLIDDGAVSVTDCLSLHEFWKSEVWSRSVF